VPVEKIKVLILIVALVFMAMLALTKITPEGGDHYEEIHYIIDSGAFVARGPNGFSQFGD
jgi:hypothetical protein